MNNYAMNNYAMNGEVIDAVEVPVTLHKMRLLQGLTQKEVADKAGIQWRQYQRFESGERSLLAASFQTACRVLEALGMDISDFYHGNYMFGEGDNYMVGEGGDAVSEEHDLIREPDLTEEGDITNPTEHSFNRELTLPVFPAGHKKAAVFTKARNKEAHCKQAEKIKQKCSGLEVVKEYRENFSRTEEAYEEMLEDARKGLFDIVLVKTLHKFEGPGADLAEKVRRLADTGVAIYFTMESYYYKRNADGTVWEDIVRY